MVRTPDMARELADGFYPAFERGWRVASSVMRILMALVLVATLVGLLGGGPVSLWTRTIRNGPLDVRYPPVVRFGTPAGFRIDAAVPPGAEDVTLTLDKNLVGQFGLQSVFPQPKLWRVAADGAIELVLAVRPGTERAVIELGGMPASAGRLPMAARLSGRMETEIRWSQLVLP